MLCSTLSSKILKFSFSRPVTGRFIGSHTDTGTSTRLISLRSDINLVLVPVSVCDPMNRPVTGLEKENFKIFDDKVEQSITHFAMDDEPVAVGLVFDISG